MQTSEEGPRRPQPLTPATDREHPVRAGVMGDRVVVRMGSSIATLQPKEARDLGASLIGHASRAERGMA